MPDDETSFRYDGPGWTPARDPLADMPEGSVDEYLEQQGWQPFLRLGVPWSAMWLESWRRTDEDRSERFLVCVQDPIGGAPNLHVPVFPDLMDLFARWAPAIQAATIAQLAEDLTDTRVATPGLVELIAARAADGASTGVAGVKRKRDDPRRR